MIFGRFRKSMYSYTIKMLLVRYQNRLLNKYTMATMTISYDGRSSVMQHLIEAMLAAGAKMLPVDKSHNAITPALRTKIREARQESAKGETVVCSSPEEMQQYFDSL